MTEARGLGGQLWGFNFLMFMGTFFLNGVVTGGTGTVL